MQLSTSLFSLLALLPAALAVPGGRCTSHFLPDNCICLDQTECLDYGGMVYTDEPGDRACPSDPGNIIGCHIYPCMAAGECEWIEFCEANGHTWYPDPVCPGPENFVCCRV
ncbi:hypothetical protein FQN54_007959 [Arachnomyces sp. PD_36]|nr:hypothetical protein FQN54_007959 [Arachnomyces sp. PD_36]